MCLIIDANYAHRVHPKPDADGLPIQTAIVEGRARLVYGGKLAEEYIKMREFTHWVAGLLRAGRARKVSDNDVDQVTAQLTQNGGCCSDDPHIIALARVSGVRLLCSRDDDLVTDFTSADLLNPKGRVYKRAEHAGLIKEHCQALLAAPEGGRRERRQARKPPRPK
jgi:hypothetical protein